MTSRVINDPSALGWEYDPDTGRWTWGGHSSSGGGGGSFPEAPVDGEQYARQNAGWSVVEHPEGGTGGNDPRISDQNIANWNASFSWGDHSSAGYLTSETDPTVPSHVKSITTQDIANWNAGTGDGGGNDPRITDEQISNWDTSYGWGNHASQGYLTSASLSGYATQSWVSSNYQPKGSYLTSETDPTVPAHVKSITTSDINKGTTRHRVVDLTAPTAATKLSLPVQTAQQPFMCPRLIAASSWTVLAVDRQESSCASQATSGSC